MLDDGNAWLSILNFTIFQIELKYKLVKNMIQHVYYGTSKSRNGAWKPNHRQLGVVVFFEFLVQRRTVEIITSKRNVNWITKANISQYFDAFWIWLPFNEK